MSSLLSFLSEHLQRLCVCVHACVHACVQGCVCVCVCICTGVCVHVYRCMRVCVCMITKQVQHALLYIYDSTHLFLFHRLLKSTC